MKIAVCVKQVRVVDDEIVLTDDETRVDLDCLKQEINEWDCFAIEEALTLREGAGTGEVIVLTVGDDQANAVLRRGLAMGADRAFRIDLDLPDATDPIAIASLLAGVLKEEAPDLVLCGTQSADTVNGSTGSALAAYLGLPWTAVIRALSVEGSELSVERELEGGRLQGVRMTLPALVTIQSGINQPRYASLRAIKKAERMDIVVVNPETPRAFQRVRRAFLPEEASAVEMLGSDAADVVRRISEIVKEKLA